MDPKEICPICGKPLEANAPKGLCPECLLKGAFPSGPETAGKSARFVAPALSELAAAFPQLEILEFIGQGGMGAVYKARQKQLDRIVALKILPPQSAGDAGFAERFTREARALARLNHPQIVAIYEFGQTGALHYLMMEFVDGANLRQIERAGHLSPEQAVAIVPQICAALQYAHQEGIVHRDIKPENILMDKKGGVKITDFGIAKIVSGVPSPIPLTGAQDIVGTPLYMAPEQIEHPQNVDHRADIYSLGVVFYEMLTGELPLGRFEPPSQRVQVDVRLDEVVLRALEKEPARRYQQASEIKTRVETITSTAQPPAPSAGDGPAARSGRRRKRGWLFGTAVASAMILLAAAYIFDRKQRALDSAALESQLHQAPGGIDSANGARRRSFSQKRTPITATAIASSLLKSGIDRVVTDEKTAVIEGNATTGETLELQIPPTTRAFRGSFDLAVQFKENTRFTNIIESRGPSLRYRVLNQAGQDVAERYPNSAPPSGQTSPDLGPADIDLHEGAFAFDSGPSKFLDAETTLLGTNEAIRIGTYVSNSVETPVFVALVTDAVRRSDNISMPFTNDPAALGRWKAVDFVDSPGAFDPSHPTGRWLWLRSIQFDADGKAMFPPYFRLKWTKGFVFFGVGGAEIFGKVACHYQIRKLEGEDYMFLEWKNDDHAMFGVKPKYYVLKRIPSENANLTNRPNQ
jgi:serine/threonine protein kinase